MNSNMRAVEGILLDEREWIVLKDIKGVGTGVKPIIENRHVVKLELTGDICLLSKEILELSQLSEIKIRGVSHVTIPAVMKELWKRETLKIVDLQGVVKFGAWGRKYVKGTGQEGGMDELLEEEVEEYKGEMMKKEEITVIKELEEIVGKYLARRESRSEIGFRTEKGRVKAINLKEDRMFVKLPDLILPESIGQLVNLQTLDLYGNQLTALPKTMGQLTNLQTLNLGINQLKALPEWFRKLKNLKTLDIAKNQLSLLPESFGELKSLQTLDLVNNQLTWFPESFGQLKNLQTIDLGMNQLRALPEWFGKLTNLKTLDLGMNQLTALPKTIGQLVNLQKLDISQNKLTTLLETIGQLKNLQILELWGNQLTTLPETIGKLTNLKELVLWGNQLTALPETIGQLKNLQILELRGNQLTPQFLESITGLVKLTHLDFYSNDIPREHYHDRKTRQIVTYFRNRGCTVKC